MKLSVIVATRNRALARLDQATEPRHLDLPGWRLHALRGDLAGYWSITVSANCRIIFASSRARAIPAYPCATTALSRLA